MAWPQLPQPALPPPPPVYQLPCPTPEFIELVSDDDQYLFYVFY
jgi:hypothetical protein